MAGLVFLLDAQPWLAVPWALGGAIIGLFGLKALRPFDDPFFGWYESLNPNQTALRCRLIKLSLEKKADIEQFNRFIDEELFWTLLSVAPLLGLFHGMAFGAIVGALAGGAEGALVGMLLGPVLIACVAALTLACMVDFGRDLSWRARLARRALLVVSPLLIVPAAWHCLRTVLRSTQGRTSRST